MEEWQGDDGNDGIRGAACMSGDAKRGVRVLEGGEGRACACTTVTAAWNRDRLSSFGHVNLTAIEVWPLFMYGNETRTNTVIRLRFAALWTSIWQHNLSKNRTS
jgi:hypothetical protein